MTTSRPIRPITLRHSCFLYTARFHPDQRTYPVVATGGQDGILRLWDRTTGQLITQSKVMPAAWSVCSPLADPPCKDTLQSAVHILPLNLPMFLNLVLLQDPLGSIQAISFDLTGSRIYVGDSHGVITEFMVDVTEPGRAPSTAAFTGAAIGTGLHAGAGMRVHGEMYSPAPATALQAGYNPAYRPGLVAGPGPLGEVNEVDQQPAALQPYPGSPQPYPGSLQPYPGILQPFPDSLQPFSGSPQPYPGILQPYPGSPQPYPGSPQPFPGSPQPYPGSPQNPTTSGLEARPGPGYLPPAAGQQEMIERERQQQPRMLMMRVLRKCQELQGALITQLFLHPLGRRLGVLCQNGQLSALNLKSLSLSTEYRQGRTRKRTAPPYAAAFTPGRALGLIACYLPSSDSLDEHLVLCLLQMETTWSAAQKRGPALSAMLMVAFRSRYPTSASRCQAARYPASRGTQPSTWQVRGLGEGG